MSLHDLLLQRLPAPRGKDQNAQEYAVRGKKSIVRDSLIELLAHLKVLVFHGCLVEPHTPPSHVIEVAGGGVGERVRNAV